MGLTIDKLLVILVIALVLLGPERLPTYAQKLGELVKGLKRMADGAKDRVKDEMGPEFDEVDWSQLDPRQYDPRKIIRDALREENESPAARRARAARIARSRRLGADYSQKRAPEGASAMGVIAGASTAATDEVSEDAAPQEPESVFNFDEEAT